MATRYVYLTGGREVTLDDPTDAYTAEQIKQHWAATFPELSAATYDTKEVEGVKVVTFAKKVGTKGSGEQWPAWISTAERMPEDYELVLVISPEFDEVTAGSWVTPEEGDDQGGWAVLVFDWDWADLPVTHWMPLPPMPEVEPAPEGSGYAVKNFSYNGFYGKKLRGFANYRATFTRWTADPGVAVCACSDGQERLIPTFALVDFDSKQYPIQAKTGVLFGEGSHS